MKIKRVVVIIVCAIIVSLSLGTIFSKTKDYSENENRHLAKFPEFSVDKFLNGEYKDGMESYFYDQFPFRDGFMSLYANIMKLEGFHRINSVYLSKDEYLIEQVKEYENLEKITDKINLLDTKVDAKISLMLVPTSSEINFDKLPSNAITVSQRDAIKDIVNKLNENIRTIDVVDTLMENKDKYQLYYKTDHHWTTYGAYLAYVKYCEDSGLIANDISKYEVKEISHSFYGTVYSKVNDTSVSPDNMVALNKKSDLTVTYQTGITNSLYNESYLSTKDKYSYFLNSINDIVTIVNNEITEDENSQYHGKVLVVVKDSYANCFIPFLTDYYEKIVVLDTRYYMYGVSTIAQNVNATDILILYNMGTIDTDTGINGIY